MGLREVVGSNEVTGPVIEQSFVRLGTRPCAADFALFGQLHPMISLDIETSRKVFTASRTVFFWYHMMKDLSGLSLKDEKAGWFEPRNLPPTLIAILAELGRLYAPFMLANAESVAKGEKNLDCVLDGGKVPWTQASFKYQAKCLGWLRGEVPGDVVSYAS